MAPVLAVLGPFPAVRFKIKCGDHVLGPMSLRAKSWVWEEGG